MGVELKVQFTDRTIPEWSVVSSKLTNSGYPVTIRMIDGQLAFPDEQPPEDWRELRLGTHAGMVTVRREADGIKLVIWGNAEQALQQARNALAWAFAAVGDGTVLDDAGNALSASDYRQSAPMPPGVSLT